MTDKKTKEKAPETGAQNLKKNADGHGYKYTDLAAVNDYIAELGETYRQEIESAPNGYDYIITIRMKDGKDLYRCRGCKIPDAKLPVSKKRPQEVNPAQEYGSGLTYARRYSLFMAYGLAAEDDDAEACAVPVTPQYQPSPYQQPAPQAMPLPYPPVQPQPAAQPQPPAQNQVPTYRDLLIELADKNGISRADVATQYDLVPNDTEDHYKIAYEQMKKDLGL